MKVTREELNRHGLLEKLPEELKKLQANEHFVFYYHVDEENAKLHIYGTQIVLHINILLYRKLLDIRATSDYEINVGSFTTTFETKDGLFYLFLRTFNDLEDVKKFYEYAVEIDRITDVNISTNSFVNVGTSEDFRRIMSNYCSNRLQTVMSIYDMVDAAMKRKLSKSLYGDTIKKVVNIIFFDGGVLPEIGGKLRYMVVGEKAELPPENKEKLIEAKSMLRNFIPQDKIYSLTGWALSEADGKWRTNISDNDAQLLPTLMYDHNGGKIYVPTGQDVESVLNVIRNPNLIHTRAYRGRLADIFSHPTLFSYYPRLPLIPAAFYIRDGNPELFYYSQDDRGGYILMNGSEKYGKPLSILLHEIQHYIQGYEGFGEGGNKFIAQFVATIGSASVRRIFSCIKKVEKFFRVYLQNEQSRIELLTLFQVDIPKSERAIFLKKSIIDILKDRDKFAFEIKSLNFYLVFYLAESGDYTTSDILNYLELKIPERDVLYELFRNIGDGYEEAKQFKQFLAAEGYSEKDISTIIFKGYENLYGEMESRSVQTSRFVESQFRNYFSLTRWENTPLQQLTVIDGQEEILDIAQILGAVERKDDDYILHFKRGYSSLPFIHELGHIVHDCLNLLPYKQALDDAFDKEIGYPDKDEWFVTKFLVYLKSRIDDSFLQKDLRELMQSRNAEVDRILDEFFADSEISDRLKFLQTLLSLD